MGTGDKRSLWSEFKKGFISENPVLVLMVGLCPALAVSSQFESTLFMGLAVVFVMACSNLLVSLLRDFIPSEIRIPIFIVVIASFVTIIDLTLKAYLKPVHDNLGIWIPLIVCNCLILARAEGFAYKKKPLLSVVDGVGMGLGFTCILMVMGFFRELLGTGKLILFDATLINFGSDSMPTIFIMFPGAFITFALIKALLNWHHARKGEVEKF